MKVYDSNFRPVEIFVGGASDDVQIVEAYYLDAEDNESDEVPEEEIEYIYDRYDDALWMEYQEVNRSRWEDLDYNDDILDTDTGEL